MGVASQIVEHMFGAAEGRLGVDDPVLPEELPEEAANCARCSASLLKRAMELELVLVEKLPQFSDELAAEDSAEHLDRQEEPERGVDPAGAIGGKSAGGNDAVDMRMMLRGSVPRCAARSRKPMSAPRCFGSRATSSNVAALARKSRS